jgi:hypothetical protein
MCAVRQITVFRDCNHNRYGSYGEGKSVVTAITAHYAWHHSRNQMMARIVRLTRPNVTAGKGQQCFPSVQIQFVPYVFGD